MALKPGRSTSAPELVHTDERIASPPAIQGLFDLHLMNLTRGLVLLVGSVAVGAAIAVKPTVGIMLVIGVAVLLGVLFKPSFGAYLLVGLVPITSGLRSGWPVPLFRLSELLIGTIGAVILVTAGKRQAVSWRPFDWLMLAYVAGSVLIGGADLLHNHNHLSTQLLGTLFGSLQFLLLYRAVAVALPLVRQRLVALRIFLLASIPVDILCLLQQLRLNGIRQFLTNITGSTVLYSTTHSFYARATGPFDHWTPLAGYLLVVLLVGIGLALHGVEGVLSHRWMFLVLGFTAMALLLSAELSAMIALIGGSLALGVWSGRVRFLLRWGLAAVVILSIAFGSYFLQRINTQYAQTAGAPRGTLIPQTIQFRIQVWTQQYFPAIHQQLLTGYGPVLPHSIVWQATESQYVTLLMWGGIPLLLIYIAMLWGLFTRVRLLARPVGGDPSRWALARALAVLVVALYPITAIYPYMTSGGLPQALFAVLGILIGADRLRQPARARSTAPVEEPLPVPA